jgi:siroheme synthase
MSKGGRLVGDTPFVSFVGAGPGEAELVTLKAVRRLREAAVVVHDAQIAREVLEHARGDAEMIDAGHGPLGQAEINWLLVDRARRRGRVVRLKGGDPGVFGRLAEEVHAVRTAGVHFEIVPGVSAAMAAAARAGISLSERGGASTVVFAPGADHHGIVPALDWDLLARAESTLVFYMPVDALDSGATRARRRWSSSAAASPTSRSWPAGWETSPSGPGGRAWRRRRCC